jgi:hypothetical protein
MTGAAFFSTLKRDGRANGDTAVNPRESGVLTTIPKFGGQQMQVSDLTNEQLRSLTPEQIEAVEADESKLDEFFPEKTATPEDKPKQEERDGAANGAGEDDGEEKPIVLNKSGKGVIPYESHQGLRVENATLKEQLNDARQRLDELMQQKEEAKGDPEATAEADEALTSHLELLKEDFPEIHQVILAVVNGHKQQAKKLEETLTQLQKERDEAKQAKEKTVAEQVAEAKDNNADLSHWEHHDPEAWEEAIKQDELLRTNAKWAEKSFDERFAEVVRRVRAILPEAQKPNTPKSEQETRAAAKAKLDKAPERQPTTLSDIHGGANPASERDQLDNLSGPELTARLMKMPDSRAAAMRADLD